MPSANDLDMRNLNDWLALPELQVPDHGYVEIKIVRAAVLPAPASAIRAVGVQEPVLLDREQDIGAVGMVTIEGQLGAVWLRLPELLTAWAVECCAYALAGGKPFPSRVRFKRHGTAIATLSLDAPGPNPISAPPCPKHFAAFLDESGNTGDAIINTPTGAFQGQPCFALACVGEAVDGERLASIMGRLRAKHAAAGVEVKGRAMKRRPGLVKDLARFLYEDGIATFIELMDKWYYVATNVVSFVFGKAPWFRLESPAGRMVANRLADLLVEELPTVLGSYSDFAQDPNVGTLATFETALRNSLSATRSRVEDGDARKLVELAQSLTDDAFEAYQHIAKTDRRAYERLLPEPDQTRGGKRIAMLAHVPAFTNLYARLNSYASQARSVNVVHDEQVHVDHVLRAYAETLGSNAHAEQLADFTGGAATAWHFDHDKFSLRFEKSDATPAIQLADILARFCTQHMNDVIAGKRESSHEAAALLAGIRDSTGSVGLNIVSTAKRCEQFYA